MNRSNRQPRGFTVVELLVVVSIILLLVAIFLPALKQAELRSKEAVCAADMRSLSQIWIQYATESFGIYPDMSVKPDGTGGIVANYWSHQEWRTYWEEQWNVERSVWYSPTNPKWNRDGFYLGGANGVSSNHWVIARHMFTSSVMNTEAWWNAMQQSAYVTTDRVPSGTWSPDRQVFARRMNQKPFFDIMMTDLCREWNSDPKWPTTPTPNNVVDPDYMFLTPNDAERWGVNHMYPTRGKKGRIIPFGSHQMRLDGGLQWKLWDELDCYAAYQGVEYWW